jgi:hypothetical protein
VSAGWWGHTGRLTPAVRHQEEIQPCRGDELALSEGCWRSPLGL